MYCTAVERSLGLKQGWLIFFFFFFFFFLHADVQNQVRVCKCMHNANGRIKIVCHIHHHHHPSAAEQAIRSFLHWRHRSSASVAISSADISTYGIPTLGGYMRCNRCVDDPASFRHDVVHKKDIFLQALCRMKQTNKQTYKKTNKKQPIASLFFHHFH